MSRQAVCPGCGITALATLARCPRCGGPMPPIPSGPSPAMNVGLALFTLAIVAVVLVTIISSFRKSSRQTDAAFCKENLAYYENFCVVYPANCKEGPRKLARCE